MVKSVDNFLQDSSNNIQSQSGFRVRFSHVANKLFRWSYVASPFVISIVVGALWGSAASSSALAVRTLDSAPSILFLLGLLLKQATANPGASQYHPPPPGPGLACDRTVTGEIRVFPNPWRAGAIVVRQPFSSKFGGRWLDINEFGEVENATCVLRSGDESHSGIDDSIVGHSNNLTLLTSNYRLTFMDGREERSYAVEIPSLGAPVPRGNYYFSHVVQMHADIVMLGNVVGNGIHPPGILVYSFGKNKSWFIKGSLTGEYLKSTVSQYGFVYIPYRDMNADCAQSFCDSLLVFDVARGEVKERLQLVYERGAPVYTQVARLSNGDLIFVVGDNDEDDAAQTKILRVDFSGDSCRVKVAITFADNPYAAEPGKRLLVDKQDNIHYLMENGLVTFTPHLQAKAYWVSEYLTPHSIEEDNRTGNLLIGASETPWGTTLKDVFRVEFDGIEPPEDCPYFSPGKFDGIAPWNVKVQSSPVHFNVSTLDVSVTPDNLSVTPYHMTGKQLCPNSPANMFGEKMRRAHNRISDVDMTHVNGHIAKR